MRGKTTNLQWRRNENTFSEEWQPKQNKAINQKETIATKGVFRPIQSKRPIKQTREAKIIMYKKLDKTVRTPNLRMMWDRSKQFYWKGLKKGGKLLSARKFNKQKPRRKLKRSKFGRSGNRKRQTRERRETLTAKSFLHMLVVNCLDVLFLELWTNKSGATEIVIKSDEWLENRFSTIHQNVL